MSRRLYLVPVYSERREFNVCVAVSGAPQWTDPLVAVYQRQRDGSYRDILPLLRKGRGPAPLDPVTP